MKTQILFASLVILAFGCSNQKNAGEVGNASTDKSRMKSIQQNLFEIKLYEHNSSLAYSLLYALTNLEVNVFQLSGIEGEEEVLLYNKKFSDKESNSVSNFIGKFPIDSLQTQYRNQCVLDGDRKTVLIKVDDMQKEIHIANFYQKDIAELIELLNSVVKKDFEIAYDKDELMRSMSDCNMKR